jgi:hypothetical protein
MGDEKAAGSAVWTTLEGALRTACLFMTTDARLAICARLREFAGELERDAHSDSGWAGSRSDDDGTSWRRRDQ